MINQELRDAFTYHRNDNAVLLPARAVICLDLARRDVVAGKKRYGGGYIAQLGQAFDIGRSRLRWTERPGDVGLRFVGYADKIAGLDHEGWYTNTFESDTIRGVVYQLPARGGKPRFVAGYDDPNNGAADDGGPAAIDFETIYEDSKPDHFYGETSPRESQAARDAAHHGDNVARINAESEREYNTAWQAGSLWNDARQEVQEYRRAIQELIKDSKANCATLRALPDSIRNLIRDEIKHKMARRSKLFAKMKKLASGDYGELIFYPGARLADAFNDGAGQTVLES